MNNTTQRRIKKLENYHLAERYSLNVKVKRNAVLFESESSSSEHESDDSTDSTYLVANNNSIQFFNKPKAIKKLIENNNIERYSTATIKHKLEPSILNTDQNIKNISKNDSNEIDKHNEDKVKAIVNANTNESFKCLNNNKVNGNKSNNIKYKIHEINMIQIEDEPIMNSKVSSNTSNYHSQYNYYNPCRQWNSSESETKGNRYRYSYAQSNCNICRFKFPSEMSRKQRRKHITICRYKK